MMKSPHSNFDKWALHFISMQPEWMAPEVLRNELSDEKYLHLTIHIKFLNYIFLQWILPHLAKETSVSVGALFSYVHWHLCCVIKVTVLLMCNGWSWLQVWCIQFWSHIVGVVYSSATLGWHEPHPGLFLAILREFWPWLSHSWRVHSRESLGSSSSGFLQMGDKYCLK